MEHSHDQEYTPEQEYRIARAVYETDRDLKHAAHHLATALVGDPHDPDRLALLDTLIEESDDPLALAPLSDEGNYFGTVAVRAYALAKLGRTAEAVGLLTQVCEARPDVPYLPWALDWLARDPAAAVDRDRLTGFLAAVLQRHPGNVVHAPPARAELEEVLRLTERVVTEPDPPPMLSYGRAALLRKLGRLDEAQVVAEAAYARHPGYHLATALAMVHQSRDDYDGWKRWCLAALEHDPSDVAIRLDLGDWHLDLERYDEAARWYEEALAVEPDHPWATPSLYLTRHKQGRGEEWLARLREYAAAHPDNDRARSLTRRGRPWDGYLPPPQEATLGILGQIMSLVEEGPDKAPTGEARVALTALEAPSARLAVDLQLAALGVDLRVRYEPRLQSPDPRLPRGEVKYRAWTYREERKLLGGRRLTTEPVPAVPEPPRAVAAAVAGIAARWFERADWYDRAAEAARQLFPLKPEGVIGAMVHPPEMPEGRYAPVWVQQVQVAAALVLANLDPEVPWPHSLRRAALLDLARGPLDWTVTAAVVALAEAAQREEGVTADALPLFVELLRDPPRPGHVCYEHAIVCCAQQLPGVPDETREHFARYQADMEAAAGEDGEE